MVTRSTRPLADFTDPPGRPGNDPAYSRDASFRSCQARAFSTGLRSR